MEALLNRRQIAEALNTTPQVACRILRERGVFPIQFGRGRGLGDRWLASAVEATLREMFVEAQPVQATKQQHPPTSSAGLLEMPVKQLYALTNNPSIN